LVVRAWEDRLESNPNSYSTLAKLGAAHINRDEPEEAQKYFDKVQVLSLDEPEVLQLLADAMHTAGVDDRAEDYLRKLLLTAEPKNQYLLAAMSRYAGYQKKAGNWRVAAAFNEVDMLYDIQERSTYTGPIYYLRKRFEADLMKSLALNEEGDVAGAKALLARCFNLLNGDGLLADDFFPLLRQEGLIEEHDRYFELAYGRIKDSIQAYPGTHNTYNSAAWLASRAARELDDAHAMATKALEARPKQGAYLDTMAEVWFAMRDREKAVEWSLKACRDAWRAGHTGSGGPALREQLKRFQTGDFPVR
jgi:tetratricopeptide (TPR) repeat protein